MSNQITTPLGRIVGGDVFQAQTTDRNGQPLTNSRGEPKTDYVLQVAFPKSDPRTQGIIDALHAGASLAFPDRFKPGGQTHPDPRFYYKYVDGDSTQLNEGTPPVRWCDKTGYPGHYVVSFKKGWAPDVCDMQRAPVTETSAVKPERGDYVYVCFDTSSNGGGHGKPGIYVNHLAVMFHSKGEPIGSSSVDVGSAFAGVGVDPLPAGATAVPQSPGAAAFGTTAPPYGIPAPVAPVAGFPNVAPAPPPVAPAPAPPAGPAMAPGCPFTYDALKAAGWTDDAMRQAGHLL